MIRRLAYLFRSGLGIPDYWHPRLELQPDFLSGKIARYPCSMDVKADYKGRLNHEGMPMTYVGGIETVRPVDVALFGLGSHDAYLRTSDPRYRDQLWRAVRWLETHGRALEDGVGWPSDSDDPLYELKAPWFSALTQGLVLSLLVRAHRLDENKKAPTIHRLVRDTWRTFRVPVEAGGIRREVNGRVIYEEYPGPRLDCVFNGMCHALIGLWEAWRSGLAEEARHDFEAGTEGLGHYLSAFDLAGWSLYSLNSCLGRPFLASPYYHRANGLLACILGHIADAPRFRAYGDRWLRTGRSLSRRAVMSLRIAWERWRAQPSLLQSDPSRP